MLKMNGVAAFMDLPEVAPLTMEVFNDAISAVCYMYEADSRDIGELLEAGTGDKRAKCVDFLL